MCRRRRVCRQSQRRPQRWRTPSPPRTCAASVWQSTLSGGQPRTRLAKFEHGGRLDDNDQRGRASRSCWACASGVRVNASGAPRCPDTGKTNPRGPGGSWAARCARHCIFPICATDRPQAAHLVRHPNIQAKFSSRPIRAVAAKIRPSRERIRPRPEVRVRHFSKSAGAFWPRHNLIPTRSNHTRESSHFITLAC